MVRFERHLQYFTCGRSKIYYLQLVININYEAKPDDHAHLCAGISLKVLKAAECLILKHKNRQF